MLGEDNRVAVTRMDLALLKVFLASISTPSQANLFIGIQAPVPFLKFEGHEFGGNDIECLFGGTDVNVCIEKCRNNPTCVGSLHVAPGHNWGSDSGCCNKNRMGSINYNTPGITFYSKPKIFYPNTDFDGNNIECIFGGSNKVCGGKCSANAECVGYNEFPSGCCLKRALLNRTFKTPDIVYLK